MDFQIFNQSKVVNEQIVSLLQQTQFGVNQPVPVRSAQLKNSIDSQEVAVVLQQIRNGIDRSVPVRQSQPIGEIDSPEVITLLQNQQPKENRVVLPEHEKSKVLNDEVVSLLQQAQNNVYQSVSVSQAQPKRSIDPQEVTALFQSQPKENPLNMVKAIAEIKPGLREKIRKAGGV
jgi:hypothetical protein